MRPTALILVVPLLLAACASSPPTHFYTLQAVPPAGGPAATLKGKPIQVRDINLPPALDRLPMVLEGPGAQVQVMGENRWAAPLKGLIRQTLTDDLGDRLGEKSVVSPGAPEPPGGVQVLILNIQQFGADASGRVTLDTGWSLGRGNPPKEVLSRTVAVHVDAGSTQPDAVAQAMSRALGKLADRIAGQL